jgi:hypothetical protein
MFFIVIIRLDRMICGPGDPRVAPEDDGEGHQRGCSARHPPLDACRVRAYKAGHDDRPCDHHSNYMPGALTKTSRREKAFEPSRRPQTPYFQHPVTKDVTHVF